MRVKKFRIRNKFIYLNEISTMAIDICSESIHKNKNMIEHYCLCIYIYVTDMYNSFYK